MQKNYRIILFSPEEILLFYYLCKMAAKFISEREELLVCKQYLDNWPLKKIATYANLSQTTVLTILRRRNISLRDGKRLSSVQEYQVVELYNEGMPIIDIMSQTDIKSEQTIYRILRDAGVERRRNRRAAE